MIKCYITHMEVWVEVELTLLLSLKPNWSTNSTQTSHCAEIIWFNITITHSWGIMYVYRDIFRFTITRMNHFKFMKCGSLQAIIIADLLCKQQFSWCDGITYFCRCPVSKGAWYNHNTYASQLFLLTRHVMITACTSFPCPCERTLNSIYPRDVQNSIIL